MSTIKSESNLYFLGITPPEPLRSNIYELKKECAERFKSKAALRSPPHITLHMPFTLTEKKLIKLKQKLGTSMQAFKHFRISLLGFGSFKPRVIFVSVEENEHLTNLHYAIRSLMKGEFNILNQDYREQPFHPHITIAFRDLRKVMFVNAWEEFRERKFNETFESDGLTLFKHNGKVWEMESEFPFTS